MKSSSDTDKEKSRTVSGLKEEYGDWQTNMELALGVCRLLKGRGVDPKVVIEPTCGKGNFIMAALRVFEHVEDVIGIEINGAYLEELRKRLDDGGTGDGRAHKARVSLYEQDIFGVDFSHIKQSLKGRETLVLGNPPWVTNSEVTRMGGSNVPRKSNFRKLGGMDAITGKSNFDVSECICRQMIGLLEGERGYLALLLKNSVARGIVYGQGNEGLPIANLCQYGIDSRKEFGVSVGASLLCIGMGHGHARSCKVKDFYTNADVVEYGWIGDRFVADIDAYQKYKRIDGRSPLVWRSGIKHDCVKVMELSLEGRGYVNGFNEEVDIEDDLVYPLLKSSDIKGDEITTARKYVIVTQRSTSDDTGCMKGRYPKAYRYLTDHAELLDKRGSRVYEGRARFCIFGIGTYSFKPYKVVVSGLYKKPCFALVTPIGGKPAMVDDTCYMLGFDNMEEARITQRILRSEPVEALIGSLLFADAKRVVNKELLMRIDLANALEMLSPETTDYSEVKRYRLLLRNSAKPQQLSLF